jgi:hypothetical protein
MCTPLIELVDLGHVKMANQFFSGNLGSIGTLLGLDRMVTIEGASSTVCQGQGTYQWIFLCIIKLDISI